MDEIDVSWKTLRSDIYIRDRGICWVCHKYVILDDYDLGHLVDRCNGGHDDYDNLAVMHKKCNLSKPRHETLEEVVKWQLTLQVEELQLNRFSPKPIKFPKLTELSKPVEPPKPKQKFYIPFINKPSVNYLNRYIQNLANRFKPGTVCWVYKRNNEEVNWRILVPPYDKKNTYQLRLTPPGAVDNGKEGIEETLQVIGGEITSEMNVNIGNISIHMIPNKDKPILYYTNKYR